jgi:hypothetical protein
MTVAASCGDMPDPFRWIGQMHQVIYVMPGGDLR